VREKQRAGQKRGPGWTQGSLGPAFARYSPKVSLAPTDLVLPEFEGPLDLLLHLVRKHELDLFNIPISFVTARYLEMLEQMRSLNVDLAGEYLLMAATLAYLKSRELLPAEARPEEPPKDDADDGEDPRQALIKRLLEYQRYKEAAQSLLNRPLFGKNVFARGQNPAVLPEPAQDAPLAEVPVWELITALAGLLKSTRRKLSHEVTVERLSLSDRIHELCDLLEKQPEYTFFDVISTLAKRSDSVDGFGYQIVLTFMAVLELSRLKLLRLVQIEDRSALLIRRVEGAILPRHAQKLQGELPLAVPDEADPPAVSFANT
jgi:segregation and condensation protein A